MFPYLHIFGKDIPVYGLMLILAIVACAFLVLFLPTKTGIKRDDRLYGATFALVFGLIGAKLFSIFQNLGYIIRNKVPFTLVLQNGFVFYGGLIGGIVGIIVYCAAFKVNLIDFFVLAAIILPLGQAIGRIGCLATGCCYGQEAGGFFWSVIYTNPADPSTPIGDPLLPTQLFETLYCLLIFGAILIISRKKRPQGLQACIYLTAYSICRFTNEFFRGDSERGFLLGLSTSQFVSIILLLCVIVYVILWKTGTLNKILLKRKATTDEAITEETTTNEAVSNKPVEITTELDDVHDNQNN